MVRYDARGNSHQPRGKGQAPPLKLSDSCKSFAKDIGCQIFSLVTVADPPDDEGIHAVEVLLVQLGKAGWVALGGLDLRPFVILLTHGFSSFSAPTLFSLVSSALQTEKLR